MTWSRSLLIRGHSAPVYACTLLNGLLYSTAGDRFVTGWDLQSGAQQPFTLKSETPAYCLGSIPELGYLLLGCANGNYVVADPVSRKLVSEQNFFGHALFSLAHCPEQKWVLAGDAEGNLMVIGYDGRLQACFPLNCGKIRQILSTGTEVFIACQDGTWRSFDLPTLNETRKQESHEKGVSALWIDSPKKQLISGGKDGHIRIWNLQTGELVQGFPAHYQTVYGIQRAGESYLSVSMDKTIKIWDNNWQIVQRIEQLQKGHGRSVNGCITVNPQQFVTFSDDRTIAVWTMDA